jgi:hypothetical protein
MPFAWMSSTSYVPSSIRNVPSRAIFRRWNPPGPIVTTFPRCTSMSFDGGGFTTGGGFIMKTGIGMGVRCGKV